MKKHARFLHILRSGYDLWWVLFLNDR